FSDRQELRPSQAMDRGRAEALVGLLWHRPAGLCHHVQPPAFDPPLASGCSAELGQQRGSAALAAAVSGPQKAEQETAAGAACRGAATERSGAQYAPQRRQAAGGDPQSLERHLVVDAADLSADRAVGQRRGGGARQVLAKPLQGGTSA